MPRSAQSAASRAARRRRRFVRTLKAATFRPSLLYAAARLYYERGRHPGRGRRAARHQPGNRQPAARGGEAAGHRAHRGGAASRGATRRSRRPAGPRAQPGDGLPQPLRSPTPGAGRAIVDVMGGALAPAVGRALGEAGLLARRRASGVVGPHRLRGRPVRADAAARRHGGPDRRRQRSARGVVPDQRDHPIGRQPDRRSGELPFRARTARVPSCTSRCSTTRASSGCCTSGRMRAVRLMGVGAPPLIRSDIPRFVPTGSTSLRVRRRRRVLAVLRPRRRAGRLRGTATG